MPKIIFLIGVIMCAVTIIVIMACEEKLWRGQKVLCCANGSAVRGKDEKRIWAKTWPVICGPKEKKSMHKRRPHLIKYS